MFKYKIRSMKKTKIINWKTLFIIKIKYNSLFENYNQIID